MIKIKHIYALLLVASIGGCGLFGPDYKKPTLKDPESWPSKDQMSKIDDSINLPDMAWWKKFNDPELNNLISDALKYNNNIQMAIGNITQAQGQLQQVYMGWVPVLAPKANYSTVQSFSAQSLSGGTSNISGGGNNAGYQVGLVPSYTLNIMQQIRSQEVAEATLASQQYAKDAMRLTVISQVAGSYFTVLGQDYLLKLQKKLVEDTKNQLALSKDQFKDGYISLLAVQQYEQQYEQAQTQVPIIENNIVQAENALQVLLNRNPGEIKRGTSFDKLKIDGIVPANLPSTVLKNRPDVISAEQQLISANANIGVATSAFFPSINLTTGAGTAAGELGQLFTSTNNFWQFAAGTSMPILNLGTFGQIKAARGAYYTAFYNYALTIRNAFAQVDNGLQAHQKIMDSYLFQAKVYDSADLANDLGVARFKQGLDSYFTELNYQVTLDNAAISLANVKLQELEAIVTLYQALAGGFNVDNTESPVKFGDAHDAY